MFARATTATIYAASARCAELQIDDARVAAATAVQNKCPPIAVVAGAIATAISTIANRTVGNHASAVRRRRQLSQIESVVQY